MLGWKSKRGRGYGAFPSTAKPSCNAAAKLGRSPWDAAAGHESRGAGRKSLRGGGSRGISQRPTRKGEATHLSQSRRRWWRSCPWLEVCSIRERGPPGSETSGSPQPGSPGAVLSQPWSLGASAWKHHKEGWLGQVHGTPSPNSFEGWSSCSLWHRKRFGAHVTGDAVPLRTSTALRFGDGRSATEPASSRWHSFGDEHSGAAAARPGCLHWGQWRQRGERAGARHWWDRSARAAAVCAELAAG